MVRVLAEGAAGTEAAAGAVMAVSSRTRRTAPQEGHAVREVAGAEVATALAVAPLPRRGPEARQPNRRRAASWRIHQRLRLRSPEGLIEVRRARRVRGLAIAEVKR